MNLDRTHQLELEIELLTNVLKRNEHSEILSENERIVMKNLLEEIKTEYRINLMQD
tara:strand:+ start:22209 stop:22376 length:168 start_codon:yes stop_codon:yes gene_type:complete